jgi:multiple sugar transport system substrate-binding protein
MKRIISVMVAALLLLSVGTGVWAEEEQIVIKLFYGTDSTGAMHKIINAFEADYPQYKVNWVEAPASQDTAHDMLVTSLAAGESVYDVFSCNVIWPAEFSQAGYCLAVDRFIEEDDIDTDEFSQGYVNAYTFQGKMWGLPWYGNVGILYYRTDIVDTPPRTWDELIEVAKAHTGETAVGYVMQAAQYEGLVCNALEFIGAYGGTIVDGDGNITINNDGVRAALTEMKKIVDAGILPENFNSFMENECQNMFANGDALFMRTWPGFYATAINPEASKVADKFAVTALPTGDAGSASTLGGWGWMINKNSENPRAAWDFISYVTGPEGQKINAIVAGQLPTYMPLYEDDEVIAANPHFANMSGAIEAAIARPVSPIYTALSEIMQINISAVMAGQMSVDDAVEAMETQMNTKIAEYNG